MTNSAEYRDARFGERMIELKVRYWTDAIAEGKGENQGKARLDKGNDHN